MIAKRLFLALTLAAIVGVSATVARAQSTDTDSFATQPASQGGILDVLEQIKQEQAQRLQGSWTIVVTPAVPPGMPQPPSFNVYGTFAGGGAFIGSERTQPFASPQHGVWAHLGGNGFAYTFKQDHFDGMGTFTGTITVHVRLTLTGKDELVGVASGQLRDAADKPFLTICATIRGERIKLEPLAEQCQNITPPQ